MGKHFVPKGYLKEWCDPDTSQGAFIWLFNKDGKSDGKQRAPKSIFNEENMYDFVDDKTGAVISYELDLKKLEDRFYQIRDTKLTPRLPITEAEKIDLFRFVAAAHGRTVAQREHLKAFYGDVKEKVDWMMENLRGATPEQLKPYRSLPSERGQPVDLEELNENATNPHKRLLPMYIDVEVENFLRFDMELMVLETEDEVGFVTSDNPCAWFDPEAWRRPPLEQSPGLMYPMVEIRLPISPKQMLLVSHWAGPLYAKIKDEAIDEMNRIAIHYADKEFVVRKNVKRDYWFDPGTPPPEYHELNLPPLRKKPIT